jgi:hypothetical protein
MDDCYSLKESNEVSFTPGAISPDFGSSSGGNYIYIYGDFPYAATDKYVQEGLVAHYDGINNTGEGDKYHSTSTVAWKNLIKNEDESDALPDGEMCLTRNCDTKGQNSNLNWTANSAYFASSNNDAWFRINKFYNPASFTLEVAYSSNTAATATEEQTLIGNWESGGFGFGLGKDWGAKKAGFAIYVDGAYRFTNGMSYDLNEIQSLSAQYLDYGGSGCAVAIYVNGAGNIKSFQSIDCTRRTNPVNTYMWAIGANPGGSKVNENFLQDGYIYSARIYNRSLTEEEIKENSNLDKIRYLAPPTVTIGNEPCTEVVVLSEHLLKCKVPAGGGTGRKNVVINGTITYSDAYEYVHPTDNFYISEIFPIIGAAGETLTLKGNWLNEITEVMVGGKICMNPSYDAPTKTYTCTLPDNPAGETNITITAGSKVYLFAKVFEYK